MKKKILSVCCAAVSISVISAAIFAISCSDKSTNPPEPASTSTLADIRTIDTALTGWLEDISSYNSLPDSVSFEAAYDGDITRYILNNTYFPAYRTTLNDTVNTRTLEFHLVIDYGTPANATTLFNKIVALPAEFDPSVKYAIPGFDAATAIGNEIGGGVTVWAHFKQFYFKIALTGYSETATAANNAAGILTIFKSAIR